MTYAVSEFNGSSRSLGPVLTFSRIGRQVFFSHPANTKGPWNEAVASSDFSISELFIDFTSASYSFNNEGVIDIAIGPSGQEQIIAENIFIATSSGYAATFSRYKFPVSIPEGSRISMRVQGTATGGSICCNVGGVVGEGGSGVVKSLGFDAVNTVGATITASSTANAKGSWTEIVAATDIDLHALSARIYRSGSSGPAVTRSLIDIAIGPSGQEQIIAENIATAVQQNFLGSTYTGLIPVNIPFGSRISVRAQASLPDFEINILLYGY